MKLSIKLFKIILSASLILIFFIYLFSRIFLLKNFTNIEIHRTHTATQAVSKYIQKDLSNLNSLNVDYAQWDDTYNYLYNRNNDYIAKNFSNTTSLEISDVGFISINDNLGNIVYKKSIKKETNDLLTEALIKSITSDVFKLLKDSKTKNVIGIIAHNEMPILISAERVSKNDGSGQSLGFFIFAKYYDKEKIAAINQDTEINTEFIPYKKDMILNNISSKKDTFVKVANKDFISGYGLLKDIKGDPSLFVKVNLQRSIFKKAENAINFYLLIILGVSLLLAISIFVLIHEFVIKRINSIKSIVENVNSSQDLSTIITLKGNDEISELGSQFNNMFNRLKKSDETIFELAYHDNLTGLPNRKKLLENISALLENQDENFAFFFIDLDNFKSINDNFGHQVGDVVLLEVAKRLKNNTKSRDIISRIGGDEFIVIVRDLKNSSEAEKIAEELGKVLSADFIYNGNQLYIGASIGISIFPEHGVDVDALIKNSDLAMYEVKNSGGYGYTLYNHIMNDNAIDKLEMKKTLKKARENNEFITYYQPIIDLKSMKTSCAEALIRWDRRGRIIPPMEFIPIAKKVGEIVEIDNWMLESACAQCKEWHKLGVKDFSVSVNISYKQLIQSNFAEFVMNILHYHSLDPIYLNLEITEDEAMEDPELIINVLSQLQAKGIKISMDDFGTGYSSLSYINKLPINKIKIDRSLVTNLENHSKDLVIIKSIILMAHSLNIKVVAEGIETQSQFNILKELECDFIQGYLIGKPMTALDFQDKFIR